MNRAVFHIRLKDFELQAERILDPALRTRPIAIISSNRQDGTIVALSNEARQEGLFRGLNVSLVRKMSTTTLLLPYNSSLYARLNGYVYSTMTNFTPVVEPAAYGQYFLDMSGMERVYRDPRQTGFNITRQVQDSIQRVATGFLQFHVIFPAVICAVIQEAQSRRFSSSM